MKRVLGVVFILAGVVILAVGGWAGSPFRGEKRFLILLQNQMELRPTGGFLGSYVVAGVKNGKLVEVSVQDIYEPDGRVTEYVEPPAPIQEAFKLGSLRLRDANWEPDFPGAAKTLMWYFRKAGEGDFDGVIATNLLVFQEVLRIVGPVRLIDWGETITAENLWEKTQFYSQEGFFPGSKQKREFLGDLAKTLMPEIEDLGFWGKVKLARLGLRMVGEKQIMVYLFDGKIKSGEVKTGACPVWLMECIADRLMVVEANLGVNKANCCLDRQAELLLIKAEKGLEHKLKLMYENNSGSSPWGGKYRAWVRVIIPFSAGGEKGFWVEVPVGEKKEYEVEYFLPADNISLPVYLTIQKQSGIEVWPITVNGREFRIKRDSQTKVEVK